MARALGFVVLGVGGWLALSALGGCNALLDIEEAQVRATAGSTGSSAGDGGTGVVTPAPGPDTCQAPVSTDCAKCATDHCTNVERNGCLVDKTCRKAVATYSNCLGPMCKSEQGRCFEEKLLDPTQPFGLDCISSCGTACATTPIISTCELYCGCMVKNCSEKVQDRDKDRYATVASCMTFCATLSAETVACRWSHCEIAPDDLLTPHCDHADGLVFCSNTNAPARPAECHNKSYTGFYCDKDADCCSNKCDLATKACLKN